MSQRPCSFCPRVNSGLGIPQRRLLSYAITVPMKLDFGMPGRLGGCPALAVSPPTYSDMQHFTAQIEAICCRTSPFSENSMDLIYHYDPFQPVASSEIPDAATALAALRAGNERFADIVARMQAVTMGGAAGEPLVIPVSPISLGLPVVNGVAPTQTPFGLVLGCSDARVPTEAVFDQSFNDLFVVRIAGNVMGTECVGSIDYAVRQLGQSLKVAVVLGHTGCGAVTAAVDVYESPGDYVDIASTHALRSLVDRIQIAVRGAAKALRQTAGNEAANRPGYRKALIEVAVYLNAALTAYDLQREIRGVDGTRDLRVVFGVCDLGDLRIRALPDPPQGDAQAVRPTFADAPERAEDFVELAARVSERVVARGTLERLTSITGEFIREPVKG